MSDTAINLNFGAGDVQKSENTLLPEQEYVFNVFESKLDSPPWDDNAKNWKLQFQVQPGRKYGNKRVFIQIDLMNENTKWLIVKMFEGIFGEGTWPSTGFASLEDFASTIRDAEGLAVKGVIQHYSYVANRGPKQGQTITKEQFASIMPFDNTEDTSHEEENEGVVI